MELPDGVLAYHVFKSVNLSTENDKLARACEQLSYSKIRRTATSYKN